MILVLSILAGVIGQLFLKKGTLVRETGAFKFGNLWNIVHNCITNSYILLWFLFGGISAFLWIIVISKFQLSFVFPAATSVGFVLIAVFSSCLFGEQISLIRWIGIVVLCLGVFLISK
jgi:multidrug transporter EmrE-like cation transporter